MEKHTALEHKVKEFSAEFIIGGFVDSQEGTRIAFLLINSFGWNFMLPNSTLLLNASLFPLGSPPAHCQLEVYRKSLPSTFAHERSPPDQHLS